MFLSRKQNHRKFSTRIKKSRFYIKTAFFAITILLLLFGIYYLVFISDIFLIKEFKLTKDRTDCIDTNEIENNLTTEKYNFFTIDKKPILANLQKRFYCVKDLKVKKVLPDKIELILSNREKKAVVTSLGKEASISALILDASFDSSASAIASYSGLIKGDKERFFIDREGMVFDRALEENNLPTIYLAGNLKLGEKIAGDQIIKVLEIVEKLASFGMPVKDAKFISEKDLAVNSLPYVVFNLAADIYPQLASLQLILNKAKIDNRNISQGEISEKNIEFIDLRYDKPVVRLAPEK
ncbi:FtsQ-type POTRA domain-containing protein [Candidatus Daviesbacteria bacterium]|nr:FtsQ-type POTRA domain-containing protein [Candidatus Daviesbacteria bacterium]